MPKISFIIPVWNLWSMTNACLESLVTYCAKDGLLDQVEIVVVDNNSSDETSTALEPTLQALFGKNAHHFRLPENLGFAKACNLGAQKAKGSLLFFLNNDTILTENFLPPLLLALEKNSNLGAVGPLLLYPGDKVQHAGICFSPSLELMHAHHLMPASYVRAQKPRFWQAITGAALLMPKDIFTTCGGFHEEYINGFEDLDLCCHIRQKGYKLTAVHKSSVYHHTSQTPGRFTHDAANAALLGKRCTGYFRPDQHLLALEAGLRPLFTPDLELYTTLSKAKEQALHLVFTQNFDEKRCLERLESEPYWLDGYDFLAKHYESQQRWEEALDMRLHQARLYPLARIFASLGLCAAHTGDTDMVNHAKQSILTIKEKTQDLRALHHKALRLQHWAAQNDDIPLKDLFTQWIEENPLTQNPTA